VRCTRASDALYGAGQVRVMLG